MNHEEEDLLRSAALRTPPRMLDARMELLLTARPVYRPRLLARPVLAWKCAMICALCTMAAFLAGVLADKAETGSAGMRELRYVIHLEQQDFDVFDWTKYPKRSAPCSLLRTNIKTFESTGAS